MSVHKIMTQLLIQLSLTPKKYCMTIAQSFLQELLHEAGSTRKLLQAMSNDVLSYKPAEKSWNMAQLACHIAESYHWYVPAFKANSLDFATYKYDKGDGNSVEGILAKFEENLKEAITCLENVDDDGVFSETWTMKMGEVTMGEMPRAAVVRNMLMNHLYHHRGQLTIYLRASGQKVPGMYGPSSDGI
jgi:uncharacterized damage-inducible protein DinB